MEPVIWMTAGAGGVVCLIMMRLTTGITVSNANTGGGAAHSIMPPSMVLPFILRVI